MSEVHRVQSGQALLEAHSEDLGALLDQIECYISARPTPSALNNPFCPILPEGEEIEPYRDVSRFAISSGQGTL